MTFTFTGSEKLNGARDIVTFTDLINAVADRLDDVPAGNPGGLSPTLKFNSILDACSLDAFVSYLKTLVAVPVVSTATGAAVTGGMKINGTKDSTTVGHVVKLAMNTLGLTGTQLNVLTLDTVSIVKDAPVVINILGATATSVIAVSAGALPTGMVLNSGARTIAGTPTVAAPAVNFTLRETLAAASNSPRSTARVIEVTP